MVWAMSTKAQAMLNEFETLAPEEQVLVRDQVISRTESRQRAALKRLRGADQGKGLLDALLADRTAARVSDGEFAAALDEVTGCTAGSNGLRRLLEDRRHDRERDEAWLEARKQERSRG